MCESVAPGAWSTEATGGGTIAELNAYLADAARQHHEVPTGSQSGRDVTE